MKIKRKVLQKQVSSISVTEKIGVLRNTLVDAFQERDEIIRGILLALLTRQNVLLVGSHGTAKSLLGTSIFKAFTDAKIFVQQCTRSMTEDALFGIPNIKMMQEEGVIEYNVEEMLPQADFAFLEEFMDANDGVLRSMLDVLNERQFRKGRQMLQCPLQTAIATTNFIEDQASVQAVLDRFLIQMRVVPLSNENTMHMMLARYAAHPVLDIPSFSLKELKVLQKQVAAVKVSETQLSFYVSLIIGVLKQSGGQLTISDRRKCWALDIARATAVLAGRDYLEECDFENCRYGLVKVGYEEEEQWFSAAYLSLITIAKERSLLIDKLDLAETAITKITGKFNGSTLSEEDLLLANKQAKTVAMTLEKIMVPTLEGFTDLADRFSDIQSASTKLTKRCSETYAAWIEQK